MFITKKKHAAILAGYRHENERLTALLQDQSEVKAILRRSGDKSDALLEKLTEKVHSFIKFENDSVGYNGNLILPDTVAQFVPDFFGGTVIKQEATKVIQIETDGSVTIGLTKRPPDEGFTYALNRKTN